MTQAALHFAVETDSYIWDGYQPACGGDFRHGKMLTDDPARVTCRACLTLCGFEAAPAEQLTECQPDPLKAAA